MTLGLDINLAPNLALVAFVFATTACPGPNAALMLAVGARGGVRAGLSILGGIAVANAAIKLGTAAAAQGLIEVHDWPVDIVRWPALAVCAWFMWRILTRDMGPSAGEGSASSGTAVGIANGVAFQLTNPKAWITGWAAATLFSMPPVGPPPSPFLFAAVALPGVVIGAGAFLILGARCSGVLRHPRTMRLLRISVAGLMAAAMLPVIVA